MSIVGTIQELKILREFEAGYILDGKDEVEVFMHRNEADEEYVPEDYVTVFIYRDHQGRYAATMKIPEIHPGHYGWAKVVKASTKSGIFVDIGLSKDLFIDDSDLPPQYDVWPIEGDMLFCTMKLDKKDRLIGKLATDDVFQDMRLAATDSMDNKNIQGIVVRTRKVGSHIFTDEGFYGFVHESERKVEPRVGERVTGRIVDVKEDGQINISLLPRKQEAQNSDAEIIMDYLDARHGAMPYSDKTSPEDIMDRFMMSKGAFKRALGLLMREGKVYQEEGWTYDVKFKNKS